MSHLVCPCCGAGDAVRKVSYLVAAGQTATWETGGALSLSTGQYYPVLMGGRQTTQLAHRLNPALPEPWSAAVYIVIAAVAGAAGVPTLMCVGLSALMGGGVFGIAFLALALVVGLGVGLPLLALATGRQQHQVWASQQARGAARWNALYYCARDDVAFDPATGQVIALPALAAYLYG